MVSQRAGLNGGASNSSECAGCSRVLLHKRGGGLWDAIFFTFTPRVPKEKGGKGKMECPEFEFMRRVSLFFSRAPIFGVFLFPLPVFCVVGKFRVYSHFPHILGHCQSALSWLLHMWWVFSAFPLW